jgi:hypothetical protein
MRFIRSPRASGCPVWEDDEHDASPATVFSCGGLRSRSQDSATPVMQVSREVKVTCSGGPTLSYQPRNVGLFLRSCKPDV